MIENDYRDKKFLIIDDFENFHGILKRMLHSLNASDIDTAVTGSQAIRLCSDKKYDVIFGDFDLGKGRNGLQVLEELREKSLLKSSTVYIMTTAESSKEAVVGSLEYKPDAYLAKPFSVGELKARLLKVLKQKDALAKVHHAIDQKQFEVAIQACDEQINQQSRHKSWCLKTKCSLLMKLGKFKEAEKHYQEALSGRAVIWAELGLADALAAQQSYEQALTYYKSVCENNPACLEAYDGAAKMLLALDQSDAAQKLLEQGNAISARSVTRQKMLADVCKLNEDFAGAAKALRGVVKLSEHTHHKNDQNRLDLADALNEASTADETEKSKEYAKEALSTVTSPDLRMEEQATKARAKLLEARSFLNLGKNEEAEEKIKTAENYMTGLDSGDSAQLKIELAKTHYQANNKEQAKKILTILMNEAGGDKELIRQIDKVLDEPLSASGKEAVNQINKKGISLYEAGEFENAAKYFIKAARHYPKHIGMRLNIVQSLINDIKKQGESKQKYALCSKHLQACRHIKNSHPQFKRYNTIVGTFKQLIPPSTV